ncbi:hypothetical protein OG609_28805 [Streptomyces sp. NBC_01224]|uniref:hypothetical protein n=1 Tax=unclassified Streptomyces TaxID=2593676 RepID=UPI002E1211FC|nr:hypothetical protein OG609_28805 [Streptomyces sp. NBC_01224]
MHRAHAAVEQVFADLEDSALAHLPSGKFTANAAWLTPAAVTYNLPRATGKLAPTFHARARPATNAATARNRRASCADGDRCRASPTRSLTPVQRPRTQTVSDQ